MTPENVDEKNIDFNVTDKEIKMFVHHLEMLNKSHPQYCDEAKKIICGFLKKKLSYIKMQEGGKVEVLEREIINLKSQLQGIAYNILKQFPEMGNKIK